VICGFLNQLIAVFFSGFRIFTPVPHLYCFSTAILFLFLLFTVLFCICVVFVLYLCRCSGFITNTCVLKPVC